MVQNSDITETLSKILDENGQVKQGFSGIGRLRGRTDYTDDERTILDHFFTNTHSNVYAATDNMPGELWALVMGQYARSDKTGRDRLLQLFTDVEKKGGAQVSEIAAMIRAGENVSESLQTHLRKAGEFIETWGVKYGHASLRDSGTIRMCFEGVSQRATKFLESAREGAYQEQSTRALPFRMENIGLPYEVRGTRFEPEMIELDERLIGLYEQINMRLLTHLKQKFSHLRQEADAEIAGQTGSDSVKITDREWDGIIASKAFDVARYLLPQNMTTSLGVTLNTRRFQDQLTEWQSAEILEMQVLGRVAQIEAMKISPQLMKYGNRTEYQAAIPAALRELNRLLDDREGAKEFEYRHYDVSSTLVAATPQLEDLVLASILLNGSDGRRSIIELKEAVQRMSRAEKRKIAESVTKNRGGHDIFSKVMECGTVTFERLYDIGAFRDLQRQRGDRQQYNRYSVIGYNMPKEVAEIGLGSEFVIMMHEVKAMYDAIRAEGMYGAAEYVPVMANVLRHVTTKDVVQCLYEGPLRTQPAGIDSYRSIVQKEIRQLVELMPAFEGLIPYDLNYYELGRLPELVNGKVRQQKAKQK
jgi:thymidylate synthase ThyX